jgi:hypothetical protein
VSAPTYTWALADNDPVAAVLSWLRSHQPLMDRFDALRTGEGDQVGGVNTPPFPRIVVDDPPGADMRYVRHLVNLNLSIQVLADVDGNPSLGDLWPLATGVVEALRDLTEQPAVGDCTFVLLDNPTVGHSTLPIGQERYLVNATLWWHPAFPAPA